MELATKEAGMRRLIVLFGALVVSLTLTSAAMAKQGCVLTGNQTVVCGTLVPPGYRAPPPAVRRPAVVVNCKRGYALVNGVCVVRRAAPPRGGLVCARGYRPRGGVCVRF
jgi:hypothetical protein